MKLMQMCLCLASIFVSVGSLAHLSEHRDSSLAKILVVICAIVLVVSLATGRAKEPER